MHVTPASHYRVMPARRRVVVAAVLTLAPSVGCWPCLPRHGDVRMTRYVPVIGYVGQEDFSVAGPRISLGKMGVTRTRLRNLPAGRFHYELFLPLAGPPSTRATPSWGTAAIRVRILDTAGTVLHEQSYDLHDNAEDARRVDDLVYKLTINGPAGWWQPRDFDLDVAVATPSPNPHDWGLIHAYGQTGGFADVVAAPRPATAATRRAEAE